MSYILKYNTEQRLYLRLNLFVQYGIMYYQISLALIMYVSALVFWSSKA